MTVENWFLKAPATSSECIVSWHVGYPSYYQRLENLFKLPGEGDEIFIVGWRFDHTTKLVSDSVVDLLQAALGRGVRVRVLLSAVSDGPGENSAAVKAISALRGRDGIKGDARLDNQVLKNGSHHQKAVYVKAGETERLLLGGMDIVTEQRRNGDGTSAWFDAQAEVDGRAAELGKFTLEERWSSVTKGARPSAFVPGPGDDWTFVQFVKTYGKPDSAPSEERTYAHDFTTHELLVHACKEARKHIYIEDQWLVGERVNGKKPRGFSTSIEEELKEAAARGVQIIAVTTHASQAYYFMPKQRRKEMRQLITNGLRDKTKFKVFRIKGALTVKRTPGDSASFNFVHSKVWIFDDKLALVGSANFSQASMTYESEFGVAVASAGDALIPGLRARLWLALLNAPGAPGGFKEADVIDFDAGVRALESSGSSLEPYKDDLGFDQTPDGKRIGAPAEWDGS